MPNTIPASTLKKFTTFGDLLRFLRRRAGITQLEFSIAVGYSDSQISRLEQNMRLPDPPMIEARFVPALYLEDEPEAVARLLELAATVSRADIPALGECPYKGLDYFDEADTDMFVGRETLIEKLSHRVLSLVSRGHADQTRFFAIVGASGSGKSSLVRAGLIPALRRNETSSGWPIFIFTPTAHPLESLATTVEGESSLSAAAALMDDLARDQRSLDLYVKRHLKKSNSPFSLIVIDQFEELFAHCQSEAERAIFIDNLMTAASSTEGQAIIMIILRADFYNHCSGYPAFRDALTTHQEYIGAMSGAEMRRAIEEPGRRGHWEFEPGLVDLILHDVGHEPGALPLLSHALLETWQRRHGRIMTLNGYASAGGVRGAIAETAEAVYTDQLSREQQYIARRIFIRLTELGDETASGDTSRRVPFNELIPNPEESQAVRAVIKALADARLVTTSEDSVQIAHEALIREWPTLRGWLEENREGLRLHRHLTEASREWLAAGYEPGLMFRGARLTNVQEWSVSHAEDMNSLEREFLTTSIASRENEAAEREAQHQHELEAAQKLADTERQRAEDGVRYASRLKRRSIVISFIGVLAIALAILAIFAWRSSTIQASRNHSLSLAAGALQNYETGQVDLALLLAKEAVRLDPQSSEALKALRMVGLGFGTRAVLKGHSNEVRAAAISPDGKSAFSASCVQLDDQGSCLGGELILWDTVAGKEVRRWQAHSGWVTSIAFSSDGQKIISGGEDGSLMVWDRDGNSLRSLVGHQGSINDLVSVPNSNQLLAGSNDGYLILWDLNTGYVVQRFALTSNPITAISLAADMPIAITAHRDGSLRLWDLNSRQAVKQLSGQGESIKSVALSPDGRWILLTSSSMPSSYLRMVNSLDGKEINKQMLACVPGDLALSPDLSSALISCTSMIIQMDLQNWSVQKSYYGQGEVYNSISLSQDGQVALSASKNGELRLWTTGEKLKYKIESIDADILKAMDISSDGKYLLISDAHKDYSTSPALWDITQNTVVMSYTNYGMIVSPGGVKISPDNQLVAAVGAVQYSAAANVKIWQLMNGKYQCMRSFDVDGRALAFSPDGQYLVVGFQDVEKQSGKLVKLNTACEEVLTFATNEDVSSIAFSRDGSRVITGSEFFGRVILWDATTGREIKRFSYADTGPTNSVAFGPQDATVLGSGMGEIFLWDIATGELILTYKGLTTSPSSVAISPDGKYVLSGTIKGELILWDFASAEELQRLNLDVLITSVLFSPNGKMAYVGTMEGKLIELQIEEKSLAKMLEWIPMNRYMRELTCQERQQYLINPQCKE